MQASTANSVQFEIDRVLDLPSESFRQLGANENPTGMQAGNIAYCRGTHSGPCGICQNHRDRRLAVGFIGTPAWAVRSPRRKFHSMSAEIEGCTRSHPRPKPVGRAVPVPQWTYYGQKALGRPDRVVKSTFVRSVMNREIALAPWP